MRISISNLREVIVKGMFSYTGIKSVDTDNPNIRPDYPFYSYKITSYNPYAFTGQSKLEEYGDEKYKETLYLQPNVVISFNSYSDTVDEANIEIFKAWEWFKFVGYQDLKNSNIVVINVGSIQDRTIYLEPDYEYRYGFDVELRLTHSIERIIDALKDFEFKKGE